MGRKDLQLREPDTTRLDFRSFPRKALRAGSSWYRQHQKRASPDNGAWYFASHPVGDEGSGRFDLTDPDGTCYLASSELGAVRELIGPECSERGWVDAPLLEGRVLSRLELQAAVRSADTTSERATLFRVTNELATTDRYDLTQAWAEAFRVHGFEGVHASLRFTTGATKGLALFGPAGAPDPPPPGDPDAQPVRDTVEKLGFEVVDPPTFAAVKIATPSPPGAGA